MSDEQIGKGEVRMEPVDVDVLDNLINAQAAFMSAFQDAAAHLGHGGLSENLLDRVAEALVVPVGVVLSGYAALRV